MVKTLTAVAVVVLVASTIACQRSSVAPSNTSNGAGRGSIALEITGPKQLAPGQAARFSAIATMSDRSTQDYTRKVSWAAVPADVLTIARTTGEGTAGKSGDAMVWIDPGDNCCGPVRLAVLVVPPNTYRLTGRVQESGLPLPGATVTVLSGIGTGLSAATDYNGQYRLYGVAGGLQVQVSKAGYADLVKAFTAEQNDVLDFPEARQKETLPLVSGSYVLTLEAESGCPTVSTDPRSPHLPAEMQRARSYTVQVTQDGPALHVAGVGPGFLAPTDRFDGRLAPDSVEFELGDGYFGYGPDNAFSVYISPTQALSYEGHVYASRVGSAIVGRLDGAIELYEKSPFYRPIGQCRGGHHRFSMAAAPPGTLR